MSELLDVSVEAFDIFVQISMEVDEHIALGNIIAKSYVVDHAEVDLRP